MLNWKIKDFIDTEAHKIHIDRSFQRKACWSDDTCRSYIVSANKKRTPYPIVVASVATGLKYSIEIGDKLSEERYMLCKGLRKDHVSLDGQNRVEAFRKLFADDLTLSGTFIDADGAEVGVDNKYYSSLPVRLQDALRDIEIGMAIMNSCVYSDLNEIFVMINSGDALNRQEKRNAINTPISEFFRKMAERKNSKEMWPQISGFKPPAIERSQDAEWTAIAYMATLQGGKFGADPNSLDSFYEKGKNKLAKQVPEYSAKNQTRFSNIFSLLSNMVSSYKSRNSYNIPQKHFWALLFTSELLNDHGIVVNNYQKVAELVVELDEKLSKQSYKQFTRDIDKADLNNIDPPAKSKYYFHWQSEVKKYLPRSLRKENLFKAILSSDLIQEKLAS
jgi:hypothetical protein